MSTVCTFLSLSSAPTMCENQCSLGSAPVGQVSVRVIVSDPSGHLAWLAGSIERQFNDLLQLRAGWDGRKALPSTYAALLRATELLGSLGEGLVSPQVFRYLTVASSWSGTLRLRSKSRWTVGGRLTWSSWTTVARSL